MHHFFVDPSAIGEGKVKDRRNGLEPYEKCAPHETGRRSADQRWHRKRL